MTDQRRNRRLMDRLAVPLAVLGLVCIVIGGVLAYGGIKTVSTVKRDGHRTAEAVCAVADYASNQNNRLVRQANSTSSLKLRQDIKARAAELNALDTRMRNLVRTCPPPPKSLP